MVLPKRPVSVPLLLGEKMESAYPETKEILEKLVKDWGETHRVLVIRLEKQIVELRETKERMDEARKIVRDLNFILREVNSDGVASRL